MKRWAVVLLLALLLAGHAAAETAISVMSCVEADAEYGDLVNAPINAFEELLDQWRQAHAEVTVSYQTRPIGEMRILALMNHLPDIFMLDASNGWIFARQGLLCDVTGAVTQSEYIDAYRLDSLTPYVYYGYIAAFPALAKYCQTVIYDRDVFKEFPSTWDALCGFDARERGYEGVISFGNGGGTPAVSALLSPVLMNGDGIAWLLSMVNGEKAHSFRDAVFTDAVDRVKAMLDAPVFLKSTLGKSSEAAIAAFASQKTPAILVSGDDVYRTLETVKAKAPELYDRLGFAALPSSPATAGFKYGLFVNAKLAEDPEKLRLCEDLCVWLTGRRYADAVASACGRQGFTAADPAAVEAFRSGCGDETLKRLAEYTDGADTCMDLSQYLYSAIWSSFGDNITKKDPDAPNAAVIANDMQDLYERYYLDQ